MLHEIDHIGIAVSDLQEVIRKFRTVFHRDPDFEETVEDQQVRIAGYRMDGPTIEYFTPISAGTTIGKFLEKRGNAVHHIAFRVDNLERRLEELIRAGFDPIDKVPRLGADGKKIAFLHPRDFNGILIELCETAD